MENIFSNSSAVDEVISEVKKDQAQAPVNPFDDFAEELKNEEFAKVQAAARWARQFDPQAYSRAQELMPEIEPERGVRQLKVLEDASYMAKYREVFDKSPQLRGYFAEKPKDLAFANPDELDQISGLNWLGGAGAAALGAGFQDVNVAMASNRIADGRALPGDQDLVAQYSERSFGARGWFEEAYVMTARQVGPLAHTARAAITGSVIGGAAGAGSGAVIGSVVPGPGTVAGAAAGSVVGAQAGAIGGAYVFQQQLQQGLSRIYFQQFRDEKGLPLEPELVEMASLITGSGGAMLESLSLGQVASVVPGAERLMSLATKEGMATALSNPGVRTALADFAKNVGKTFSTEVTTEVLQQGLQIVAGEMAKAQSSGDFKAITAEEAADQLYEAGVQATQVMTLMAPIVSSTRFGADLIEIRKNKQDHDALAKTITQLDGNQLIQRAPDMAQTLIDKQLGDQKLYLPAEEAQKLFQSQGNDLASVPMRNWRERLNEALATNDEVEISVGEFIAHLSKDPKDNALLALVRTSPGGYSQAEIQSFSETLDQLLLSEVAQAQKVTDTSGALPNTPSQPVEIFPEMEELRKQITDIGFTKDAVDKYVTLFSAYFNTMAQRAGTTPSELFNQYSVEVQRGLSQNVDEGSDGTDTYFQARSVDELAPVGQNRNGVPPEDAVQSPLRRAEYPYRMMTPARQADAEPLRQAINEAHSKAVVQTIPIDQLVTDVDAVGRTRIQNPSEGPVFVEKIGDTYHLRDGNHRVTRAILDGKTEVEALVADMNFVPGAEQYRQDARGSISFSNGQAVIQLFEQADMSTLLHEAGHFFLNNLRDLAKTSPAIQADWDLVRKKLGIKEDGKITREQHEKFAKWTEAYFFEGKAPAPELQGIMTTFSNWMKAIYKSIRGLGVRINDDIRGVFDRMLVTEQRFEELAADRAFAPLIKSAEEFGMDPAEYLTYQNMVEELKAEAMNVTRERIVGQQARLEKGWRGEILKELTREFEAKLKKTPPYSQYEKLKTTALSMDPEQFNYGPEAKAKFPAAAFKKSGVAPEVVSELLGYPSVDDMVYDFVNAPPLKDAAKEAANQEMINRFGEDYDNSQLRDTAIKAMMAQDGRLTVLATEYLALRKKAGQTRGNVSQAKQMAREIARNVLYKKKVGEISISKLQQTVDRLGTRIESAVVKGDWKAAADFKRKQLMAQALANEASVVNDKINKIRDKAARYTSKTSPTIDPSFMERIRDLVEQYEFAKVSGKKLTRRESLRQFIDKVEAEGQVVVDIPARLLREVNRVNYKELTVDELLGLGDLLDNLEHLGRTKNKLKKAQAAREFNEVKQETLDRITQRPARKTKMETYSKPKEGMFERLTEFHASLLKPEQIIEWLDLGDINGPLMENIFQPIVDAQNLQNDMMTEYNGKLTKIFDGISSKRLSEIVNISSLNTKMTLEEVYAVALNTGNLSSRTKLLEGEVWTEVQLQDVLSRLSKDDWDRIQKVWDLLDTLWPKIAMLEKKLTGVAPPQIEGAEFTNQHGTYRGGYYPVVYDWKTQRGLNLTEDTTPADQSLGDWLKDNRYIKPGTNHKFTIERTKVAKPIKLSLAILPAHVQTVVHDLAYREPVRGAYKLLWDPEIRKAISDVEGEATYKQLQHWLKAVATERPVSPDEALPFLSRIRVGATLYGMGYRLSTAMAQPLGFFNTMTRVNKGHLLNGVYQMTAHPVQTMKMVNELSGEMRHRFNQQDRDIKDTVKKLSLSDSPLDRIRGYAFYMVGAFDKYVSTASWLGAYSEFLAKNPTDVDGAVKTGDRTVRLTQGAGSTKDLAKVMNSGEWMKLFTMFYSFFSGQYNAQVDLTRKTQNDIKAGDWGTVLTERLPQWMYLVVFPAILGAILGGQGPEEEENLAWWATRKTLLYPLASVPFVREVASSAESGFDYQLSPITRFFGSSIRAFDALTNWEKDLDEKIGSALRPAAEAGSIYFKLPSGAVMNSIEGLWDGATTGDYKYDDILLGRRPL